ncbi:MAG: hypothetical protein KGH79_02935 [Patescibacteria group bacterium]|nr:hypothetical protein [Patescibacteria group bacterium]
MSQKLQYAAGAVLLLASSTVRLAAYPIVTSDYTYFLSKWFDALAANPGLSAFKMPFADYAPLYLYALKLLTFIPISSLYSIKTLSLVFDIALASVAVMLVRQAMPSAGGLSGQGGTRFFAFAVMMSVPTFVINDSLWGQSDIIYASGVAASLYFVLTDRPLPAVLFFALALSVKAQAVFFFPVLLGYAIRKRAWWQLSLIPAIYLLAVVPAWLGGGSFPYWFFIYLHQAGEYNGLSVSAQSIFAFANPLPLSAVMISVLFYAGILAALACAAALTVAVVRTPQAFSSQIVLLALLCASVLPYLLPRMHERYFFLADVFSVLYALYVPRRWYLPAIVVFASLISYMPFLSGQVSWFSAINIDLRIPSVLMLVAIVMTIVSERLQLSAVGSNAYT